MEKTPATRPRFQHTPLPHGRFIRVLELHPASKAEDQLDCKLEVVNFDEAPAYEPIPYAWGDAKEKEEINCDGQLFFITTSLSKGLRRMRLDHRSIILWADGICIDQTNDEEKSHQVAFMSQIYRRGACTLIWLGDDDHNCVDGKPGCIRAVFEVIKTTSEHYSREYEKLSQGAGTRVVDFLAKTAQPKDLDSKVKEGQSSLWACVGDFYRRPWFTRCWVLIEVGVSRRAQVICGQEQIAWSNVALMIQILGESTILRCNPRPAVGPLAEVFSLVWASTTSPNSWINEKPLLQHMAKQDVRYYNSESTYLLKVLDTARKFNATDARDHIFAFLGHPSLQGVIKPNYSISPESMHISLAGKLLRSQKSLDILCFVKNQDEDIRSPSLPSWVPQWHRHNGNYGTVHRNWKVLTTDKEPVYSINGGQLLVTGFIFDEVDACSEQLTGRDVSFTKSDSSIETLWTVYQNTKNIQTSLEAFVWTLVDGGYPRAIAIYADFLGFCESHCSREFLRTMNANEALQRLIDENPTLVASGARFRLLVQDRLNTRKFFTMKSSGVCGLGPGLLSKGDMIAAVFGCSMPLVLKRTHEQGNYKLVGACYVDWLVCDDKDNFVMRDWRAGELKEETFSLV